MEAKTEKNKPLEKVYVIQPILSDNYKVLHEEAISLIQSIDAVYVGTTYQAVREINPATFIGTGKLEEIREFLSGLEDITVLFNGELSPSQTLNISAMLENRKVIDRTTLILDIFAKHARSSEGKIQVELAQLKYLYPRLKGKGEALSRLGGGIGTRGPGETQLETDRRHIRTRISFLENALHELEQRRTFQTERRKKNNAKTIALIGYTNTGKSTLMNLLTGADVLVKDALFATLDPTARSFTIEDADFVLMDTVGFLQELPHNLIEAFHSTLEAAVCADLALIVCDAQGEYAMQLETTLKTLQDLQFDKPYLVVMNKSENLDFDAVDAMPKDCIYISAKENKGIENLKRRILDAFRKDFIFCTLSVPYAELREYTARKSVLKERTVRYTDDGAEIRCVIPAYYGNQFEKWMLRMH